MVTNNDPNKKLVASDPTNGNAVPGNTPAATGVSTPSYTPINANEDSSKAEHLKQKEIYSANPDTNKAYTNEELKNNSAFC